jgi:hypothetical protein
MITRMMYTSRNKPEKKREPYARINGLRRHLGGAFTVAKSAKVQAQLMLSDVFKKRAHLGKFLGLPELLYHSGTSRVKEGSTLNKRFDNEQRLLRLTVGLTHQTGRHFPTCAIIPSIDGNRRR